MKKKLWRDFIFIYYLVIFIIINVTICEKNSTHLFLIIEIIVIKITRDE
jgi:hypothetical protein